MFVDNSGRRSKLLRRIGLLLGVVCLAYAGVLGAAFMGWGTSLNPSSLLPFGGDARGGRGPGDLRPDGGTGSRIGRPSGIPSAPPSDAATPPTSSASAVAAAD